MNKREAALNKKGNRILRAEKNVTDNKSLLTRLLAWLPGALFESFLIVFSVMLALVLNGWRDEREQQERVDQALAAIHAEISENRRLVVNSGDYHQLLEQTFEYAEAEQAELPDLSVVTRGLIAPAPVTRTAWDSAQSAGLINTIPYETLLLLSRLYEVQAQYTSANAVLMQALYTRLLDQGVDSLLRDYSRFIPVIHDTAQREGDLSGSYERVMTRMNEHNNSTGS